MLMNLYEATIQMSNMSQCFTKQINLARYIQSQTIIKEWGGVIQLQFRGEIRIHQFSETLQCPQNLGFM